MDMLPLFLSRLFRKGSSQNVGRHPMLVYRRCYTTGFTRIIEIQGRDGEISPTQPPSCVEVLKCPDAKF